MNWIGEFLGRANTYAMQVASDVIAAAQYIQSLPPEKQIELKQLVQHFEEGARGLTDFVKRLEGGK